MQRVQKILAERGLGSRRQIEAWIKAGEVSINGETAVLGSKASNSDTIKVRGRTVPSVKAEEQVILYNKPEGQICTRHDPEGRPTVFSSLPKLAKQRWVAVGRLDINSSGLIIFTTDGELANKLMHPSANLQRVYAVRVLGNVTTATLEKIQRGVTLDDGTKAKFNNVKLVRKSGANSWYHVTLTQGRYREVRRIWSAVGIQVSRLIRISYGDFVLPKDLAPGKYIAIDYAEASRIGCSNKRK